MIALLQDCVARQAARRPEAPAIVAGAERVSYGELDARSNQLARLLRDAAGCRQGDRVMLLLPKSPAALVGLLAIYKADCIAVPLDPAGPAVRIARVLESCGSRAVLAAGPVAADILNELCSDTSIHPAPWVGWVDATPPVQARFAVRFTERDVGGYPNAPIEPRNRPHDAAHILFTSGSTGRPKGVVISHANVIAFVEWACRYFAIASSDRLSGHSPLHFDLSTFDIFGTFAAGAALHLVPPELNLFPHKLADFIRSSELTQWFSVPSVLNYLAKFDAVRPGDFPALQRVMWCGEVFPTPGLIYWMKRLPHVTFTNLYGPTEATIASGYYTVKACPADPIADVPIGTGCEGEELLVLNRDLEAVAPGETGDLYIRGVGLSSGYWRDPERTAAAFLPNPRGFDPADRLYRTGDLARLGHDGLVYFVGRADSQIKSRGYRIELGEIEAALGTVSELREAAVVGMPTGGFEGTVIACAYAPAPNCCVSPADLRKMLSALVPSYMLPSRWMALPTLPKNATGKIDRRAIRDLFDAHEAVVA
jgi:amino acid adenylation domain-containing protein